MIAGWLAGWLAGTGSSGIQAIPELAAAAGTLTVFQRTPNYTMPAGNMPLSPEFVAEAKRDYATIRSTQRSLPSAAAAAAAQIWHPALKLLQ